MSQNRIVEHVYHPEKSPQEFQSIRINLQADQKGELEGRLLVSLDNEAEMTFKDIQDVLVYLEKSVFKRRRINVLEDCDVSLTMPSGTYAVVLDADLAVKELKGE